MSGSEADFPRVTGRRFVPIFVAVIAVFAAVTLLLAKRIRPVAEEARRKTFPLTSELNAFCQAPGTAPVSLRASGRCPLNAPLEIEVTSVGPAVKSIAYAVLGNVAGEPIDVGEIAPGARVSVDPHSLLAGTHLLAFVISDQPANVEELRKAIAGSTASDIPNRLVKVEQYATAHALAGAQVTTDRLQFRIDAP